MRRTTMPSRAPPKTHPNTTKAMMIELMAYLLLVAFQGLPSALPPLETACPCVLLSLGRDGEALVELPAALLEFLVGQGGQPARDEAHVLGRLDVRALREAGHALRPGDVVDGHGHDQRSGLGAPEDGPRRRDLDDGGDRLV